MVGESGSGQTNTGHVIMGFHSPTDGKIYFKGEDISISIDKRSLRIEKEIQIVFRDPGASLNPKQTVKDIVKLSLLIRKIVPKRMGMQETPELYSTEGYPFTAYVARIRAVYMDPTKPPEAFTPLYIDVK